MNTWKDNKFSHIRKSTEIETLIKREMGSGCVRCWVTLKKGFVTFSTNCCELRYWYRFRGEEISYRCSSGLLSSSFGIFILYGNETSRGNQTGRIVAVLCHGTYTLHWNGAGTESRIRTRTRNNGF